MALLSKKEFAKKCEIKSNDISTYVKRGKIILDGDRIDDTIDKNKAFIDKRIAKLPPSAPVIEPIIVPTAVIEQKKHVEPIENLDEFDASMLEGDENQSFVESERQLKYLDTQKRKKEIEKLDIDIAKKKGEVIPSELVKPIFLQHNQSIVTEFKNAADEIVRIFALKKSLSVNERAEIIGQLVECINTSLNKATKLSVKAVKNIISEFSEKKSVGEKNG